MDSFEQKFIEQYREHVARLEAEAAAARARLDAIEQAISLSQHYKLFEEPFIVTPPPIPKRNGPRKRRRALSAEWREILRAIAHCPGGASLDELELINARIDRKLLRTQLAYYIKQGLVFKNERTGLFYLTEDGIESSSQ